MRLEVSHKLWNRPMSYLGNIEIKACRWIKKGPLSMESEGPLFKYLHGNISFNEWLDGQATNLDFVEGLLGKSRPRLPMLGQHVAQELTTDLLEEESPDPSTDTMSELNEAPLSPDFDDDGSDDGFDSNVNESMGFTESMEPRNCRAGVSLTLEGLPSFSLPPNIDTDKFLEDQNARDIVQLIKNMYELLSIDMKKLADGNTDASIAKCFQEVIEPKVKRLRKSGPSSHKLREDLRQQMGVANLYLAKGKIEEAIDICMEIIRQAPHNPHAFKTLSVIYEEKGDAEKALQFALISAFIGCRDAFEWRDLAQRCVQAGHRKQAMLCYSRACKLAPQNIVLLWERATLFFENEEFKKSLDCCHSILKRLSGNAGNKTMEVAKAMAQIHHDNEQYEKAIDILESVFQKFPENIDSEGLNILAELHLSSKNFERALQIICTYAGVKIPGISEFDDECDNTLSNNIKEKSTNQDGEAGAFGNANMCTQFIERSVEQASSANVVVKNDAIRQDIKSASNPGHNQTDLTSVPFSWTEFLLSPHEDHSKMSNYSEKLHEKDFLDLDKQDTTAIETRHSVNNDQWMIPDALPIDIRVKIALCLININKKCSIEHILGPLRKEKVEDVGDLYLDVAEAYIDVGRCEDAISYLECLVKVEKYSMAAVWLKLAECKNAAGYTEDAIEAYYHVLRLAPDQLSVRLELSNLCRSCGRKDEAVTVLSEQSRFGEENCSGDQNWLFAEISKKEDFVLWHQKCTILHGQGETLTLAESGYVFFMNYFRSAAISRDDGLSKAMVWEMLIKVLQAMVSSGCNGRASEIVEKALTFRPYCENKRYRFELDFLGATVYFLTKNYTKAFDMFRWALIRSEKSGLHKTAMWNFFARIVNNLHDRRYHKYVLRLLFKQPAILPLIITNGHNAFLCGSYKYALGEYIRAFRIKPIEPMLSLCVGITYLHLACQRFTKHRHTSVLQGIAFLLQYYQMREKNQEACYNLARAFHQIGLVHLSVVFYTKALEFPLLYEGNHLKTAEFDASLCLYREAAYNLALIYKNCGNKDLARRTLYKYIWV